MTTTIQELRTVDHYTGGEECQYGCGEPAEYVVQGTTGTTTYTFAGCRECLNGARIYPIDSGWVDERTDKHRMA